MPKFPLLGCAILLAASLLNCGNQPQPNVSAVNSPANLTSNSGGRPGLEGNSGSGAGTGSGSGGSSSGDSGSGSGGGTQGTVIQNLQSQNGWTGYALLPPSYDICSSCTPDGPQAGWSMMQGVSSPSLSGDATQFDLSGQTDFADILWNNHLIGDFSSQGLPDTNHTLNPATHNFTYDVYFYATNIGASQALEFDINQFVNGQSFIWGHECRIAGGNEWDIWDNQASQWHPTGVACNPLNEAWNHLTIQVQRTADNQLLFESVTLNGDAANLNYSESPTSSHPTWYGITINYQQDGNASQQPYSIWLDQLNFTYW